VIGYEENVERLDAIDRRMEVRRVFSLKGFVRETGALYSLI